MYIHWQRTLGIQILKITFTSELPNNEVSRCKSNKYIGSIC